ncbi:MAG: hypothetical protein AAFR45_02175, partial [Pseudomonadota bacterium]
CILLTRALLARAKLALIDADEVGLRGAPLARLINHLEDTKTAALIVTTCPEAMLRLGQSLSLEPVHSSETQTVLRRQARIQSSG